MAVRTGVTSLHEEGNQGPEVVRSKLEDTEIISSKSMNGTQTCFYLSFFFKIKEQLTYIRVPVVA